MTERIKQTPLYAAVMQWMGIYQYLQHESQDKNVFRKQITWHSNIVGLICAFSLSIVYLISASYLELGLTLFAAGASLISLYYLNTKRVDTAIAILISGVFIAVWGGALLGGGLDDVGIQIIYPIFIIISVMYSKTRRFYVGVLTLILILALVYLESLGLRSQWGTSRSYVADGIVLCSIFLLTVVILNFVMDKLDRVNQKFEKANADLENLITEKDALLSMITHDMKSPLTTIGLCADMLKRHPDVLEKRPQMVDAMIRSQQKLTELVENILNLEQLKMTGEMTLNRQSFNLVSAVETCIEAVEAQSHEKGIDIIFSPVIADRSGTLLLDGDQVQIHRMMTNLVTNAIKYSPPESCIRIFLTETCTQIELAVQDEGYGIPAEQLPDIFEFYNRARANQDKATGSGIGLAIVKAIAEQHGGEVSVSSTPLKGSTFTVTLPKPTD